MPCEQLSASVEGTEKLSERRYPVSGRNIWGTLLGDTGGARRERERGLSYLKMYRGALMLDRSEKVSYLEFIGADS